jgi:response regulator RpfG family c-di-GMP phosphodiesterase
MVVDDDPEVVQILTVNLSHANMEVVSACNGSEALAKAASERPDMIVLDVTLPDLEGFEICRRLKESPQTSHVPVIIIGTDHEGEMDAATLLGRADHYIAKPFDPAEVVSLVRSHFRRAGNGLGSRSGLLNRDQLHGELAGLIEAGKQFATIFVDMDDLRSFNRAYGFAEGDHAIRILADVVRDAVQLAGNPSDLGGYLGGDNFAVISTAPRARALSRRIIADFNDRFWAAYDRKAPEPAPSRQEGQSADAEWYPSITLSVVAVTTERRTFRHYLEVTEAGGELLNRLRRLGGSNLCVDQCEDGADSSLDVGMVPYVDGRSHELKVLQRVLGWASLFTDGIEAQAVAIQDALDEMSTETGAPGHSRWRGAAAIRENAHQLLSTVRGLTALTTGDWIAEHTVVEDLNLAATFDWLIDQMRDTAERRGVTIAVDGAENAGRLIVEERNLARSLLCLLRSEVNAARQGDVVNVVVADASDAGVDIQIGNRNHYAPQRELAALLQGRFEGMASAGLSQDLYLAKVLVRSVGGQLRVTSDGIEGTAITISVPRRWRSSTERINALVSAAETSRRQARGHLEEVWRHLAESDEQLTPDVEENLKNLEYKTQELIVLCNRSLFMADDLSSRLESDHDRLLRHDSERLATLEGMLAICRETAIRNGLEGLFELGSAQRVARNGLLIADRFRLSSSERQALRHAALLKDLGLVSCPEDMVELGIMPSLEEAVVLRKRFNTMWQALSRLSFLSPALVLIWHHHERHDGTGHPFGVRGADIPLGARILAIADAFDGLTSGSPVGGALAPEMAVQKLAAESGKRFDPDVVSIFLRLWRGRDF